MTANQYFAWIWKLFGNSSRWSWIYRVQLWVYQHLKYYAERQTGKNLKAPVRLFFFAGNQNFGDQLNLAIMRFFNADYAVTDVAHANIFCIGSILEETLISHARTLHFRTPVSILGTGFMMCQECALLPENWTTCIGVKRPVY